MTTATIYHNPKCGTSRNVLALLREAGIEPVVVEYLKTPPTRDELAGLATRMGGATDLLRAKEPLAAELGLVGAADDAILTAIAAHPELLNRPVVVTDKGVKACRPAETVHELL
jgi:arsenate reductase